MAICRGQLIFRTEAKGEQFLDLDAAGAEVDLVIEQGFQRCAAEHGDDDSREPAWVDIGSVLAGVDAGLDAGDERAAELPVRGQHGRTDVGRRRRDGICPQHQPRPVDRPQVGHDPEVGVDQIQ